jgi:hypothetical protein
LSRFESNYSKKKQNKKKSREEMAQTLTISMSRTNAQPWGFRLQGGLDFATPLTVLRVSQLTTHLLMNEFLIVM